MKLVHSRCNVSCNVSVEHQINFAQHQLLDAAIPLQLRAISYIRICSIAMQKYQRLSLSSSYLGNPTAPYLSLLKLLSEQQINWWSTCQVSPDGLLESSHSTINTLLQPLNAFVSTQLISVAA